MNILSNIVKGSLQIDYLEEGKLACIIYLCAKSCLTLCDPMDCSPPGSSVQGILQARILEWVAISSSRGSSPPRDQTHVSCSSFIGRQILYHWVPGKPLFIAVRGFQNKVDSARLCEKPDMGINSVFLHWSEVT